MRKIRIGNDIHIIWNVTVNGGDTALTELPLTLELTDALGRIKAMPIEITDNGVETDFFGRDQQKLGAYILTLWMSRGEIGQAVVDVCDAFALVKHTKDECGEDDNNLHTETVSFSSEVAVAVKGVTPHIGENGNWFIADEDTGVRAKGVDGKDGESYVLTDADRAEFTKPAQDKANEVEQRMKVVENNAEALGEAQSAMFDASQTARTDMFVSSQTERGTQFASSQSERTAQFNASNETWNSEVNNVLAKAENAVRDAENAKETIIGSLDKYVGEPINDITDIL